jgi:hypothetical protein
MASFILVLRLYPLRSGGHKPLGLSTVQRTGGRNEIQRIFANSGILRVAQAGGIARRTKKHAISAASLVSRDKGCELRTEANLPATWLTRKQSEVFFDEIEEIVHKADIR